MNHTLRRLIVVVLVLAMAGCATSGRRDRNTTASHPGVRRAWLLYEQGKLAEAMIQCIDVSRTDPDAPGLSVLQSRISRDLTEERAREAKLRNELTMRRMAVDAEKRKSLPYTFGMRRFVNGETSPLRTPDTAMQEVLQRNVNVHLENVNLADFVLAIGESENVNIIADDELSQQAKTMTLHADDTPLVEVLDYVSRNLDVTFSVGNSILWATPRASEESDVPLDTRMYRLRKGISSEEVAGGEEGLDVVQAIQRFVPETSGADLYYNRKAHVLIVKNTRGNLSLIEDLIAELDVSPPQVLIEARFISTSINDLDELGIDWVLNSAIAVTEKAIWDGGTKTTVNETEIESGTTLDFVGFANAGQGLNLAYQGILTDPMFKATIHALEVSGKSRTLSVPRVTTVNNKDARIRIGRDFRYFEEYDVVSTPSTSDDGETVYRTTLVPVGSPQLEELGIELQVTPSVGADRASITLNMLPKITDFVRYEYYETAQRSGSNVNTGDGTNTTSLIKLPIFSTSELETELIVHSGQTVVMGGLITTTETKTEHRVPIISYIPLLGRLFRHDVLEEAKENLLIFVTATILSEWGESLLPLPVGTTEPEPDTTAGTADP